MKAAHGMVYITLFGLLLAGCKTVPGRGDKAPEFTGLSDAGQKVASTALMGEKGLVLYFYPKDETPGCIKQACKFQDKLAEFQKSGYRVVGVSVDTGESHQAFKANHKLEFTLVSDTDKAIAKLYNVPTGTDPVGSVGFVRTTFVISKDGMIRNRFDVPDPEAQVDKALSSLNDTF